MKISAANNQSSALAFVYAGGLYGRSPISVDGCGLSWCRVAVEYPGPMGYNCSKVRKWRVKDGKMERPYDFWVLGGTRYRYLR
jgi:hypothetical protein